MMAEILDYLSPIYLVLYKDMDIAQLEMPKQVNWMLKSRSLYKFSQLVEDKFVLNSKHNLGYISVMIIREKLMEYGF
jgi:hypothetical protein